MIEIRDCRHCKYSEKYSDEEPCNTCLSRACNPWELWEPQDSEEKGE